MPDLDARRREALAAALGEHVWESAVFADHAPPWSSIGSWGWRCPCGEVVKGLSAHRHHVADALAPLIAGWLAEAEAAALREAAEDFATGAWADAFAADEVEDDASAVRSTERWLLARADRIGGAR